MVDGSLDAGLAISDVTGAVGGRVARRLASAGRSARLIVLDAERNADLPEMEVVEASYRDPASMRRALAGAHTFFMIPAHEAPDRLQRHATAVDAAVEAGVGRIVYSSFVGAAPDATFTFARDHWHTEEHIRNTGLDFAFLRGNVYMDVLPWIAGTDGLIRRLPQRRGPRRRRTTRGGPRLHRPPQTTTGRRLASRAPRLRIFRHTASIWKRLWRDLTEAVAGSVTGPHVTGDSIVPRYLKPAFRS